MDPGSNRSVLLVALVLVVPASAMAGLHQESLTPVRCQHVGSTPKAPCHAWKARYGGPGDWFDRPAEVVSSPDGSLVHVVGASVGDDTARDVTVVTYTAATGEEVWRYRYDASGGYDVPSDAVVGGDGTVYVAASSSRGEGEDYLVLALRGTDGQERWTTRFDGPADEASTEYHDLAEALRLSPDGSQLVVTGTVRTTQGGHDPGTLALGTASGSVHWTHRIEGPGDGTGTSVAFSPDGSTVYVAGEDGPHALLAAYDADRGDPTWTRTFDGVPGRWDATELFVDAHGHLLLVGNRQDAEESQGLGMHVTLHDPTTGEQRWTSQGPAGKAVAAELGPDREHLYVAGTTTSRDAGAVYVDAALVGFDVPNRSRSWTRTVLDRYEVGIASDLEVGPDGKQLYATMVSASLALRDSDVITLQANASNGGISWAVRYPETNVNYNSGLPDANSPSLTQAAGGDRIVSTLAADDLQGRWDFVTLGYDADGPTGLPLPLNRSAPG